MMSMSSHQDSRANVLLVEDNVVDAEWAIRALRNSKAQDLPELFVEHVDRLQLALARLEDHDIHLIVLDLGLPDVTDDLSSVEEILAKSPDVPIIVYSGSTYEQQGLAALEKGALYFFPKASSDRSWFLNTVVRALERHQLQENLRRIIEKSEDGMAIFSPSGALLFANPAAHTLLGIGTFAGMYRAPFSLEKSTISEIPVAKGAAELRLADLEWNGKPATLATLRDVTARQAMENQLRQVQKMEAIGMLAGGLAHDLNNILTVVNGYANMVMDALPQSSPARRDVNEIQLAGEKASTLIRRLLSLSQTNADTSTLQLVSPDRVVRQTHALLHRLIGRQVALEIATGCPDHLVMTDSSQLEQAIINLVINARDAMPNGGKITIRTAIENLNEKAIASYPGLRRPGPYVLLEVSDTGTGMEDSVANRIFEPFFTTKGPERGTGLGLAVTYTFVRHCEGSISVLSQVGLGTRFRILLPGQQRKATDHEVDQPSLQIEGGDETILLVEDEAGVRRLAGQILRARGYNVIEAADPDLAIDLAVQHRDKIDLLVTDIIMPIRNGRELSDLLRQQNPRMKTLFVSGYSVDAVKERGTISPEGAFLQKPFSPHDLSKTVRTVLDSTD